MAFQIRPYQSNDRPAIDELVYDGSNQSADRLDSRLKTIQQRGGKAWVIYEGETATGYVYVDPVPSLEQVYDLYNSVRFGFSPDDFSIRLLGAILDDLQGTEVRTLSYAVKSLESPEARFLIGYGFLVEHTEIRMRYQYSIDKPEVKLPRGYEIKTFPIRQAIPRFRALYEESFNGLPWNQPYESHRAVSAELVDPEDLLFLMNRDRMVGFAWLRWTSLSVVELEPFGIIKSYAGKGLGSLFLEKVLTHATSLGAQRMELGVWLENKQAIKLYRKIGFKQVGQTLYLAFEVESKAKMSQ